MAAPDPGAEFSQRVPLPQQSTIAPDAADTVKRDMVHIPVRIHDFKRETLTDRKFQGRKWHHNNRSRTAVVEADVEPAIAIARIPTQTTEKLLDRLHGECVLIGNPVQYYPRPKGWPRINDRSYLVKYGLSSI
jgi:hypothetical protein